MQTTKKVAADLLTRRQAALGLGATAVLLVGSGCAVQSSDENIATGAADLTVDSIAQLRTVRGAQGMRVKVLGFAKPGDGGEGVFAFTTGSNVAIADDVGYMVKASGGWWERQLASKDISVKWFGAVGDGAKNDGFAVGTAAEVATALKGRVFVPNGLYKVDGVGQQISLSSVKLTTDSEAKLTELIEETGLTVNFYPSAVN